MWVTRAGFEPAISTLRGWRPGPLDERAGEGAAKPHRRASGVYAIDLADHEPDAAERVGHAAGLVVDQPGGGAGQDQLALVDVTCLAAFGGEKPDPAGGVDARAPAAEHFFDVGRRVGADQDHVHGLVGGGDWPAGAIQGALAQGGVDGGRRLVEGEREARLDAEFVDHVAVAVVAFGQRRPLYPARVVTAGARRALSSPA